MVDKTDFEAQLANLNKNDTTKDLSDSLSRTVVGLGNIFSDTVGKMILIMVVVLIGIVAVAIGIAVVNP